MKTEHAVKVKHGMGIPGTIINIQITMVSLAYKVERSKHKKNTEVICSPEDPVSKKRRGGEGRSEEGSRRKERGRKRRGRKRRGEEEITKKQAGILTWSRVSGNIR
jgi:hypothetical protein